ncbi:MAG TPA: ribonuclease J [Terriglobales bacterium]|nr:ribonuclease J [Terriglobales bacterium]
MAKALQLIPLGGLGEFGLNMMAIRYGEEMVVVDCGLMFPEPELLGIDIVVPDVSFLVEHRSQLKAILFTHAHEDHIGALPFVIEDLNVPIYGTEFTLAVVESKLAEHRLLDTTKRHVVKPLEPFHIGSFKIEYIHVTHSIVGACAIAITTPAGVVIHTGDFKIDPTPTDHRPFDLHTFAEYGKRGVLALMSDSTNVDRRGYTPSELAVRDRFDDVFANGGSGRIFICCFTSSIHRIQLAVEMAAEYGRKVCFLGRSMDNNTSIAHRLDFLHLPDGILIRPQDLRAFPRDRVAVVISGSQAEPMSALARASVNSHKFAEVSEGDTVVLSSRIIPGNEKAIFRMINHLFKRGAQVVYETDSYPPVHVSGHASQEELKLLINLVRPRHFIPVHGEFRQLSQHAKIARSLRIPGLEAHVAEDGEILEMDGKGMTRVAIAPTGRVFIDSGSQDEVAEDLIVRDRRHLAEDGIVLPILAINKATGRIQNEPEIVTSGFVSPIMADGLLTKARQVVADSVRNAGQEESGDWSLIKERIRRDLRKYLQAQTNKRPLVLPVILEV